MRYVRSSRLIRAFNERGETWGRISRTLCRVCECGAGLVRGRCFVACNAGLLAQDRVDLVE
jgi:hypothetical protein